MKSPHRFLVCRTDRRPVTWEPPIPTGETGYDLAYFGRALAATTQALRAGPPLTFVLTWDVNQLPVTGPHVVAIVQGDEDARVPAWANEVLITFKCYGTRPHWMPFAGRAGTLEALEFAHFMRRVARWLPGAARRAWAGGWPWQARPPVLPIPLGYYNQLDHPPVPFFERKWSLAFAGSGARESTLAAGWRARLGTPKDRARAQMRSAVARLAREHPDESVAMVEQDQFPVMLPGADRGARRLAEAYSELLAQTRICLVPRGNSPETFRFFEALRAGCVVVCESLPGHWFYRGAPALTVRHWEDLGTVLAPLLADRTRLADLHRASVRWWETRCSETALGEFMAAWITQRLL